MYTLTELCAISATIIQLHLSQYASERASQRGAERTERECCRDITEPDELARWPESCHGAKSYNGASYQGVWSYQCGSIKACGTTKMYGDTKMCIMDIQWIATGYTGVDLWH